VGRSALGAASVVIVVLPSWESAGPATSNRPVERGTGGIIDAGPRACQGTSAAGAL